MIHLLIETHFVRWGCNKTMNKSQHNRGTLRDTFIVLFILVAVVPLFSLGFISLSSISEIHKKNVNDIEHQALQRANDEITTFFTTL